MQTTNVSFESSQFDRIFPFYLLINHDLVIESCGKTIKKLFPGIEGASFFEHFHIKRPELANNDFASLEHFTNQVLILEYNYDLGTILRGQIELMQPGNLLLFIGSPWFGSMEDVIAKKLRLDDFACHDPMIDLLHLLKTQEITTNELKKLLQTINRQKNELKAATKEIRDIALFPMQNPDPLIRINFKGEILLLNPAAEKFKEYVYNNKVYSASEFWLEAAGRLKTDTERQIIEVESAGRWLSFVIIPLPGDGYYNIYGRDVTGNKEREEQLLILSSIAAENTNAVVIADRDGKIEWINKSFEKITGYTLEEIKGKRPGRVLQGKDTNPATVAYLKEQVRTGQPFFAEILNYHKNGNPYWLRVQGQALRDSNGRIMKYFAIEEDITIEKETQEKLREFETRFRIALEKIGDNVWEYDFRTSQSIFSNAESHFLGIKFHDRTMNDNLWWSAVYKEDLEMLVQNSRKIKNGEIDHYALEYRMHHADGSLRWVLDRGVVIEKDINGIPIKIIGTHTDVTKQKETEKALIEAKNLAEETSRMKESFLANMSHEIRTPLNAIIGIFRELSRESLSPKQSLYLKNASLASQHLMSTLNDILDFSKIESGQMILSNRPFDFRDIIIDSLAIMEPSAGEKMLKINQRISPDLAIAYMGDANRIRQVLLNVISNAIKFTDEGSITIVCELDGIINNLHRVKIRISDTGIGMEESFLSRIFDKFSQDDSSAARKYGGTGLGLSIVKELVNLMQGDIRIESSPGRGTTVEIELDVEVAGDAEMQNKSRSEDFYLLRNKNILLVEDNDLNRMVTENLLSYYGVEVAEAVNGIEAVDILKDKSFDLVLMDLQMPNMGGMEATEIIRKKLMLNVPVIALTANAFKAELDRCMAVGMNDYITKPYEESTLLDAILRCIPRPDIVESDTIQKELPEKLYNLDYLSQFTRGNNEFMGKLIREFIDQTPKVVSQIIEAVNDGDLVKASSLAHKIKSNIDMFGVNTLKTVIRRIESLAKENNAGTELESLTTQLNDTVNEVVKEIVKELN